MSERTRAFRALAGEWYPRVGDRAMVTEWSSTGAPENREVEVTRISMTGKVIWARFVTQLARAKHGAAERRWHRRAEAGSCFYYARDLKTPPGRLMFRGNN